MKMIGLVGGLGPAATIHYYRRLVALSQAHGSPLRLLLANADVQQVLALTASGAHEELAYLLADHVRALVEGGAQVVALGAVTPHLVVERLSRLVDVPLVDLIQLVKAELHRRSWKRVVVLGTRSVMLSRLFGALEGASIDLDAQTLDFVHQAYTDIVRRGETDPSTLKQLVERATSSLRAGSGDGVVLAGTEFSIAPADTWAALPSLDCAELHVRAILHAAHGD